MLIDDRSCGGGVLLRMVVVVAELELL